MNIDFAKGDGLVPAIVQDSQTGAVLMLGYMNAEALEQTQRDGRVTFFSRSKQRLWTKGETSGNFLQVDGIEMDCDRDAVLIQARPAGPTCHRGTKSCFGEDSDAGGFGFLGKLQSVIKSRRASGAESSYTSRLLEAGVAKVAQKVGEESVELLIEALREDDARFREEGADLLYHLLVLCEARGVAFDEIVTTLADRHKP